jgi:hypothetical protein
VLTEDELVRGFEEGTLSAFPHAEHVRLTIVYLTRHGRDETIRKMSDGLLRFATAKGQPGKFHVTMTRAWVDLVESARRTHPGIDSPGALVARCPQLLDRDALLRFYSPEVLHSADARERWIDPDRASAIGIDALSRILNDATAPKSGRI